MDKLRAREINYILSAALKKSGLGLCISIIKDIHNTIKTINLQEKRQL